MTKEAYLAKRKSLTDEAQTLIDSGKLEDFDAKRAEIEKLDEQYDNEAKAQANLNALMSTGNAQPLENSAVKTINGGTIVDALDVTKTNEPVDMYDSPEYKNAFMKNVLSGTAIPAKFQNADANTATSDVGTVIPTTTMQKIVEKMEALGMILPLVTRTSYKGGLAIPTSSVKPVATWVAEGGTSDKQKKTTGSITFTYFKLRCAISMSLEVSTVTYPMFEAQFVQNVADAMVKTKEQAIISGTGSGQPKGILAETPVTGQALTLTEGTAIAYSDLVSCEAALPQAYDNGAVWCMTKKTFFTQIKGMVDSNKQPIAAVNQGINGKPEYYIFGRRVILVGDYMSSWASSVTADTIVAFMFNFADYVLNTNLNITVKRYEDNDTDDQVIKAIELVDGKVVDKNSLVTLTITNAA